jgi:chemotaxis protein methyltransferase CheR
MTDLECVAFLQWALPRLGLHWQGFRKVRRQVCRRVQRRVVELGLSGIADYRAYLDAQPGEWSRLDGLCHVTISRFYRDKCVFDFLRRSVLPALARDAETRRTGLVVWSAGCASGEEPYTLALLWQLAAGVSFPGVALRVLATDADETMLRRARTARYPESALRDLPPSWRERCFREEDDEYRLLPAYRRSVELRLHDVRDSPPGTTFDLVLCRNVAFTYFDLDLQGHVAAGLAACLRPGGALVIGGHETLPEGSEGFSRWSPELPVFKRASPGGARPQPASRSAWSSRSSARRSSADLSS